MVKMNVLRSGCGFLMKYQLFAHNPREDNRRDGVCFEEYHFFKQRLIAACLVSHGSSVVQFGLCVEN